MYLRALVGKENALGVQHTSTLTTVHNLGILYAKQGKPGEEEKMYKQALSGFQTALGLGDPRCQRLSKAIAAWHNAALMGQHR